MLLFSLSDYSSSFADDIDIMGRTTAAVVKAVYAFKSTAKNIGLTVSDEKTKFITITDRGHNLIPLKIHDYVFEEADQFKYLDTVVNNNGIIFEIKN